MKVNVKTIHGGWAVGHALDKHTVSSDYIGDDENGRPQFNTIRTEVGEALYQLKYRSDWSKVAPLAAAIVAHGVPNKAQIQAVVPMPASSPRPRQPVHEIAVEVARLLGVPLLGCLTKTATSQLKNLATRDEKDAVLEGAFTAAAVNGGPYHVLLVDDLYHTGATMDAAYRALIARPEISAVTVVALTWR